MDNLGNSAWLPVVSFLVLAKAAQEFLHSG
jgi:hypothetical protein